MLSAFIVNMSILISFTYFWHQLFRNHRLKLDSPYMIKMSDGIIAGLLGIVLMHYSIQVNDITLLDLRHIPVLLVAYYGGFVPSLTAAIIISIGRFQIAINESSITSLFMMLLIALGAAYLRHLIRGGIWKKWAYMLFYSQILFTLALYLVVEDFGKILEFAFYHSIISIVGGYITLHFLEYIRRNTELYRQYKEFSQKDYLTGLNNARGFDILFNQVIADIKQRQSSCCLCMIDIDYFKKINDTHGHQAGDEILKQFATILSNTTHFSHILSRNGGEEFSILIPDCDTVMGTEIAERVRQTVENNPFKLTDGKTINISVSIGLSCLMNEDMHPDALIGQADDALYKAKHSGRNLVVQYYGL